MSQVVTEKELVDRSNQLLSALNSTNMQTYCHEKLGALPDQDKVSDEVYSKTKGSSIYLNIF